MLAVHLVSLLVKDNTDQAKVTQKGRLHRQAAAYHSRASTLVIAGRANKCMLAAACAVALQLQCMAGPSGASSHRASPGAVAAAVVAVTTRSSALLGTAAKARNRCSHTAAAPHDDR